MNFKEIAKEQIQTIKRIQNKYPILENDDFRLGFHAACELIKKDLERKYII
jgi:hypothetical protein